VLLRGDYFRLDCSNECIQYMPASHPVHPLRICSNGDQELTHADTLNFTYLLGDERYVS